MKKVLITGANGQLGRSLATCVPENCETLVADKQALDITNADSVDAWFAKYQPDAIINAAAYTAVDKAESETDLAKAVNADGPENLAKVAARHDIPMVHVSTDFVFNGKAGAPYQTTDATDPVSVYGSTKSDNASVDERKRFTRCSRRPDWFTHLRARPGACVLGLTR